MNGKLGAAALCCLVLTACGPPRKGAVVVGRDGTGALVAVMGFCTADRPVGISVHEQRDDDVTVVLGSATTWTSSDVLRVVLRPGLPPEGWSGESWRLPYQGAVVISGHVLEGADSRYVSHYLKSAEVDLTSTPLLPGDAEEQVRARC